MFGETDEEACLRLRQIEILAPEINKVSSFVTDKETIVFDARTVIFIIAINYAHTCIHDIQHVVLCKSNIIWPCGLMAAWKGGVMHCSCALSSHS